MDVDQPVAPSVDEIGGQKPHEAGQADKLYICFAERLVETSLESGAIVEFAMVDDSGLNAAPFSFAKAGRIGAIGQDENNFGGKILCLGGIEERSHVASAPRNQNRGPGFRHCSGLPEMVAEDNSLTTAPDKVAKRHDGFTGIGQGSGDHVGVF